MVLPPVSPHFITTAEWHNLVSTFQLNVLQQEQFKHYLLLLLEWNQLFNITAITDPKKIIQDHFYDSLVLTLDYQVDSRQGIADIGSGGGFPGIPLKIKYPEVPIVLVEVTQKKITFLKQVIEKLRLPLIEVCSLDWRTFVRKKEYTIDTICARASLRPEELLRVFNKDSVYYDTTVIYWASDHWILADSDRPYFNHEYMYINGDKKRKLVFFTNKGLYKSD